MLDNSDFDDTAGTVVFPQGSAAGDVHCMSIMIIDDNILELEEHFVVTASREDLFSNSMATVVIQDDDGKAKQIEDTLPILSSNL